MNVFNKFSSGIWGISFWTTREKASKMEWS
jgi:hypothetical protein